MALTKGAPTPEPGSTPAPVPGGTPTPAPGSTPAFLKAFSPQGLLLAAVCLVVGIVIAMPLGWLEAACILALALLVALQAEIPLPRLFLRSLAVLPVAGALALFAPLRSLPDLGPSTLAEAYYSSLPWLLQLVLVPWLSVLVMATLASVLSLADLLYALERLHVPQVFVLLLTFMHRYVGLMRAQLVALRRSVACRAPTLGRRRQALLYGSLAGSLIVRAEARGQRIHAAMLARGFTGSLPRQTAQRMSLPDIGLAALAVVLGLAFSAV